MSVGTRMSSAFHRIAAVSSIRLVRRDDVRRAERHGSVRAISANAQAFASEVERAASRWEQTI